ncbi:MAG: FAD:protein FMN transferase [Parvibaculum sp.]
MGGDVSISLDGFSDDAADRLIDLAQQELHRFEAIFSLYDARSSISHLNRDGHLDAPPRELLDLLDHSDELFQLTGGAFDPTVSAGPEGAPGNTSSWQHVEWNAQSVKLPPRAALTLNGIAQGYATDRVCALFAAEGASHSLVNLGEYRATGPKLDGAPWIIGLRDPDALWRINGEVLLVQEAVATSSNTTPLGVHILDPKTGRPPTHFKSVSVRAPSAVLADGLSTALFVLPVEQALKTVEAQNEVAARFITANDEIISAGPWAEPGERS